MTYLVTMEDTRFDSVFSNIADSSHGIQPLMETFFGFLARKTDFYSRSNSSSTSQDPAKDVVLACYEKCRRLAVKREQEERAARERADAERRRRATKQSTANTFTHVQKTSHPQVEEILDDLPAEPVSGNLGTPTTADASLTSGEPVGNGGVTDKYTWTQTLSVVDVYVAVPKGTTGRQCNITLKADALCVVVQGKTLIDGRLHDKIRQADSMWTLEDQTMLHLVLEKVDCMKWWSCVIQGDPEIDTQKIVPENSKLSDLDPELRQTVEKMMFDQEQKALGLPTSDQRKQADLLEQFKKAHPEMDFSKAKISGGNNMFNGQNFQF